MVDHDLLLDILLRFSRTLVRHYKVADVLPDLCADMTKLLAVDGAGIMLEDERGVLRFVAASDEVVGRIELLQLRAGEGPCIRAYETASTVAIPDLATTDELPMFAPLAVDAGMRAVFSFAMRVGDITVGAYNIYRRQPGELDDEAVHAAEVLADLASTYIVSADAVERSTLLATQLQRALDSRVVIEQAKGVLSHAWGVNVDDAFEQLRTYARSGRVRLHDVAVDLVEGRRTPEDIRSAGD
ncbi:MAG TPA: GAF and ANTAR domain-containing protein [Euzebyales bacterium]